MLVRGHACLPFITIVLKLKRRLISRVCTVWLREHPGTICHGLLRAYNFDFNGFFLLAAWKTLSCQFTGRCDSRSRTYMDASNYNYEVRVQKSSYILPIHPCIHSSIVLKIIGICPCNPASQFLPRVLSGTLTCNRVDNVN